MADDAVQRLTLDRLEPLARTVAAAFADDPVWQWLFDTNATIPVDTGLAFGRWLVAGMTEPNEILGFDDNQAVALWTAPGNLGAESSEQQDGFAAAVFGPDSGFRPERGMAIGELMRAHHPEEPHWYLGIIGVAPEAQGQGRGARMLRAMHRRCDELGLTSYLESSNPLNHTLYLREGYIDGGDIVPDGGPPLRRFTRPAGG